MHSFADNNFVLIDLMTKLFRNISFLILVMVFSSCITNKKIEYLQDADDIDDATEYAQTQAAPYILRAGDELYIDIVPLYEEGGQAFQTRSSSGGSSTKMTSNSAYFYTYPIYEDGTVDYPYVGRIRVAGLTMEQVRDTFKTVLTDYLDVSSVTVKLASNYVNILGEVKSPGRKQITTEKLNIFEALALAGDMNSYGKRAEVKIVRETIDGPVIKAFDIRNKDIVNSEYYWVQPGDIIYVSRVKGQFFKMDSFSDIITVFSSSLSLILLSISLSKL